MRLIRCSVAFSVCFLVSFQLNAMHIIVDPGHGGMDSGATQGKIREAEITLEISKKLYALLSNDNQFKATLTRNKDEVLTLFERSDVAIKNKGDIFVSIHANSSPDPKAKGAEFFFQNHMPADEETLFLASRENDESHIIVSNNQKIKGELATIIDDVRRTQHSYASQILAETLIDRWKKKAHVRERPIKQGPFHVLVNIPMPSVLIEVGFVTHKEELKKLASDTEQQKIAEIIYSALKDYKEKIDKSEFSRHIIGHARR